MLRPRETRAVLGLGLLLSVALACAFAAQSRPAGAGSAARAGKNSKKEAKPKSDRTVWNLDGGAFFATDGGLSNGACFRLSGRVTAPGFFDNLKRIDDAEGTSYRRGSELVTHFPDQLFVEFSIKDSPCSLELSETSVRLPLTPEMLATLRLRLFWKNGLAMQPVENAKVAESTIRPLEPYAQDVKKELPQRYEWFYLMTVPSAEVPLTDSLVFVLETPDGHFAARVAARL